MAQHTLASPLDSAGVDWRTAMRANDIARRPAPRTGPSAQPASETRPSQLLVPLSVIREEEEAALMAELEAEERMESEQRERERREREQQMEEERLSGVRPSQPPPTPRPRIVEAEKPRRPQVPLRASIGEAVGSITLPPPNSDGPSAEEVSAELDRRIAALVSKHETLRSRPEPEPTPPPPPPPPKTSAPRTEPDFIEGPSGRRSYSESYRRAMVLEYRERSQKGRLPMAHFADEKGIERSTLGLWLQAFEREQGLPMAGKSRRSFSAEKKAKYVGDAQVLFGRGMSVPQAATQLGLAETLLRGWLKAAGVEVPNFRGKVAPGGALRPGHAPPRPAPSRSSAAAGSARDFASVALELSEAQQRVKELKRELVALLGD